MKKVTFVALSAILICTLLMAGNILAQGQQGEQQGQQGMQGQNPSTGTPAGTPAPAGTLDKAKGDQLNINKATADEFTQKLHLSKECAQQVVDYRTKNGSFKKVEDFKNIECIAPTFDKISGNITIEEMPKP